LKQKYSNQKDLLLELVRTNFKLRYNNSVLGFIWVLLKPLATYLVLYIVFSKFKGGWVENYQIYLLLGTILFNFFNEGIVFGMQSILNLAHIILKVNFPREIALASSEVMAIVNLVINLVVLGIFTIFNPVVLTISGILYFVFILFVMFVLSYALSFFTSIIIVKLRDLEHVTTLGMQLLYFGTPIFYPIESLPENLQKIISVNPLTILVQASREALIYGRISYLVEVCIIGGVALILLFLGSLFFRRNIKRVAEFF